MSRSQGPVTHGGNGQPQQWPQGQQPATQPPRQGAVAPQQLPGWPQHLVPQTQPPPYRGQAGAAGPAHRAADYAPQFEPTDFAGRANGQAQHGINDWSGGAAQQTDPYAYPGAHRAGPQAALGYAPQPQHYGQPQFAQDPVYAHPQEVFAPPYAEAREPRTGSPQHQPPAYPGQGAGASLGGYEPWPGLPAEPPQNARGYDLGHYAPSHQPAPYPPATGYGHPQLGYSPGGEAYADPQYQQQYAPHAQPGAEQQYNFGTAQGAQPGFEEQAQDGIEEYEDDIEPSGGRRKWLLVSAVLVLALGVGGGGAYVYKSVWLGGGAGRAAVFSAKNGGAPPTIAADRTPTKIAPAEAGGREFPNKDLKLYDRFGETRTAEAAGAPQVPGMVVIPPPTLPPMENGDPSAPRAVRTIPISPSGQAMQPPMVQPSQPLPQVPNAAVRPNTGPLPQVPGMSLENLGGRAALSPDSGRAPEPAPTPVLKRQAAVQAAQVVETPRAAPSGLGGAAGPSAAVKKAAAKPAGGPVPKAANEEAKAGSGGGYVAWVTSHQSQGDAIAQFANLKQKFPDILAGRQPDIKTTDLKDKGTWYRVRIGPAASKTEVDELCLKLKASGVKDCFAQHQ